MLNNVRSTNVRLVGELSLDELTVEASDVGDRLVLRALSLAGAGVGAVTEAELLHLSHHVLHTASSLYAALRQESELADLGRDEKHSRAVLTSSDTSTAADAGSAVHSLVGSILGDEDSVGILSLTGTHAGVATGSDDLVEC